MPDEIRLIRKLMRTEDPAARKQQLVRAPTLCGYSVARCCTPHLCGKLSREKSRRTGKRAMHAIICAREGSRCVTRAIVPLSLSFQNVSPLPPSGRGEGGGSNPPSAP